MGQVPFYPKITCRPPMLTVSVPLIVLDLEIWLWISFHCSIFSAQQYRHQTCATSRPSKENLQKKVPTARLGSCPDPGLNRGHLDLQSNALPTELPRPTGRHSEYRSTVPVPSPHRHLYSR